MTSVEGVAARVDGLVHFVRLQTQLIALGLLAATLLAPLGAITVDDHTVDEPSVERLRAFGILARLPAFAEDVQDLDKVHPYAAQGSLWLIGIGIGLLTVGLLATALAVLTSIDQTSTRARWLVGISLAVLVIGSILVAIGLGWYPEINESGDEQTLGPSWGLLVPMAAAVWIGVGRAQLTDLS